MHPHHLLPPFFALLLTISPALADAPVSASEHFQWALEDEVDVSDPLAYGAYLFENCTSCHSEDGSEGSGGDIRGSDFRTVKKMTTAGLEDMPEFDFEKLEIDALVAYLGSL